MYSINANILPDKCSNNCVQYQIQISITILLVKVIITTNQIYVQHLVYTP